MYFETLDLVGISYKGSSRPKLTFLKEFERSAAIQTVIWDNRISSVNDLIILFNRSISPDPLSPISAWNGGKLLDPWCYDALEYCWLKMKRDPPCSKTP